MESLVSTCFDCVYPIQYTGTLTPWPETRSLAAAWNLLAS